MGHLKGSEQILTGSWVRTRDLLDKSKMIYHLAPLKCMIRCEWTQHGIFTCMTTEMKMIKQQNIKFMKNVNSSVLWPFMFFTYDKQYSDLASWESQMFKIFSPWQNNMKCSIRQQNINTSVESHKKCMYVFTQYARRWWTTCAPYKSDLTPELSWSIGLPRID